MQAEDKPAWEGDAEMPHTVGQKKKKLIARYAYDTCVNTNFGLGRWYGTSE